MRILMCTMHRGTLDNTVFHLSIHGTSCEGGFLVREVLGIFHNQEKTREFPRIFEYTDLQVSVLCRYENAQSEVSVLQGLFPLT